MNDLQLCRLKSITIYFSHLRKLLVLFTIRPVLDSNNLILQLRRTILYTRRRRNYLK